MKRIFPIVLVVVANLAPAALLSGCAKPKPAVPAVVAEDPELPVRRGLFGAEALAPEVKWRDSGLGYHILNEGTPPKPGIGAIVKLTYVGRLQDGTIFDRAEKPVEYPIGGTIPGLSTGLQMLGAGSKAVFFIPPQLGYGARKVMGIPPNSGLIFDVDVIEVK